MAKAAFIQKTKASRRVAFCAQQFAVIFLLVSMTLSARLTHAQTSEQYLLSAHSSLQNSDALSAQRLYAEAEALFREGTSAAVAKAILKYQEALQIHQRLGNRFGQYVVLT